MTTLEVRNVHEALPAAILLLFEHGTMEDSRNGSVAVFPNPISIAYRNPLERVLFWHERDANPFMHFCEALWMIAGRNDLEFPATYAKQLRSYSDDGQTLGGAYGYRWRNHWDFDQLKWAVRRLRADPNDRRVVVSMWNADLDPLKADNNSRDVPCNTQIYFAIRNHKLCMQVCCRSNDLYWGCLGANAVHFSMLQEYMASCIGVPAGWYFQTAFNLHWYDDFHQKVFNDRKSRDERTSLRHNMTLPSEERWNPYSELPGLEMHAMVSSPQEAWDAQLAIFLAGGSAQSDGLTDPFFTQVAVPIRDAHAAYRNKDYAFADEIISQCAAADWRLGCHDWLNRRTEQRAQRIATAGDTEPDRTHP